MDELMPMPEEAKEILLKTSIERGLEGMPVSYVEIAERFGVGIEDVNRWAVEVGKPGMPHLEQAYSLAGERKVKARQRKAEGNRSPKDEPLSQIKPCRDLKPDDRIEYVRKNFKVKSKADQLGRAQLVAMEPWPAQVYYAKNRTTRDIIVKGRQQGMSTGVCADNAVKFFTEPYHNMSIITHDGETSEFLLQTFQRFHDNLPESERSELKWSSANRKYFPELDAYAYVDSANSSAIGIGHGLTIVHLSEVSRWPDKKARDLFAGVSQTVPMTGHITIESTPKGRSGIFYEIYQAAKKGDVEFKAFFFPWWWSPDYYLPDVTEYNANDKNVDICARLLGMHRDRLVQQEEYLMKEHKLTPGQIAWRRLKIKELRELFFQEYPENDVDCWLSNEMAVVDGVSLRPYYQKAWEGINDGPITTWKGPEGGRKYVIGVDVASGAARDYSVATVLCARNMEYVARLRGKIHPDLFAEDLYRLGRRYNDALIAVERAGHGHSVLKTLLDKNYPNLYYHTDYDEFTAQIHSDVGWDTSSKTKLPMVNTVVAAFRSANLLSYSMNLVEEAAGLMWQNGIDSKMVAGPSQHDDEFMALAITLMVRENEPIEYNEYRVPAKRYARVF